jgi:hypothetical protein
LLALLATAGGVLAVVVLAYRSVPLIGLELAGDTATAVRITGDRSSAFRSALDAGWLLTAGYVLAFVAAGWLGRRVAWTPAARRAAGLVIAAALAAGAADMVVNVLLRLGLHHLGTPDDLLWRSVQTAAYLKFALLAYALPAGVAAWAYALGRLVRPAPVEKLGPNDRVVGVPPLPPPAGGLLPDDPPAGHPLPPAAHWAAGARVPPDREPAGVGICVSGGGIRSACVALGALQSLRDAGELQRARYLVSVSGGGYLTGALQLAMQPRRRAHGGPECVDDPNQPGPEDVLAPGSVEEDHLRRHSRYIANTGREWAVALAILMRGLLLGMALITLTVAVLGFALAAGYQHVPVTATTYGELFAAHASTPFPVIEPGVLIAIGLAGGAAFVAYLIVAMVPALLGPGAAGCRLVRWSTGAGGALAGLTVLLTLLGLGVPALVWVDAEVLGGLAAHGGVLSSPAGGAVSSVLLAYLGALAGILWRHRSTISTGLGRARGLLAGGKTVAGKAASQAIPHSLVQKLVLKVVFLVLTGMLLLALGWVVGDAIRWPLGWPICAWVILVAAATGLDQTWLSLHPFYRRRIATAFSVRRATTAGGQVVAAPYPFGERTVLSQYGAPPKTGGFPQVIFAAAANLSGSDRTPPGRPAVSFTLSHDWIGGPDLGWMPTAYLEGSVRGQLQRDLTVQAAVAISGAAFSSAMGRQTRAYQTFFALSNARLGAWLPNPAFVHLRQSAGDAGGDWRLPGLPRLRRLTYLLREIFGAFPPQDRLLFCTDGGHYENLGLVELLRHRARLVYCIDASGDSPPFATTFAEAITLAREELGVRITLDEPRDLVAGGATALDPTDPLAQLNARLSKSGVVVGRITYPELVTFPGYAPSRHGALVLAKATLPAELPYELLSYAASNPVFPRDSTSDQWFDHGQFDAYHALGSYLGRKAAEVGPAAAASLDTPQTAGPAVPPAARDALVTAPERVPAG